MFYSVWVECLLENMDKKKIQHTGTSYLKFRNVIRFKPEESCWGGYELLYLLNCNWLWANATITGCDLITHTIMEPKTKTWKFITVINALSRALAGLYRSKEVLESLNGHQSSASIILMSIPIYRLVLTVVLSVVSFSL